MSELSRIIKDGLSVRLTNIYLVTERTLRAIALLRIAVAGPASKARVPIARIQLLS